MSKLDYIVKYLEDNPPARERKNKFKVIRNIIHRKYGVELDIEVNRSVLDIDRYWRRATQLYPHIRGSDYDRKASLEDQATSALGYDDSYIQSKLLKKLVEEKE